MGYNLCEPYLKRGTLCEIRPIQVKVAWRVWVLDEVLQAITDVHRAPHSIRRPPSSKESGYDKGDSICPVRSGMFSAGLHIHMGDRFKNQLSQKISITVTWEIAKTHSKDCQTEKPELRSDQ